MEIVKKLEELKTAFRGYDKEAVHIFIQEILQECEQDKDTSMAELVRQNQTLQTEVKEGKERLQDIKEQYLQLMKNMSSMSEAVGKGTDYTRERDQELDEYKKKEKEIEQLLEKTREEAQEERDRILEEAQAKRDSLFTDVEAEKAELLSEAKAEAEEIVRKAQEESSRLNQEAQQNYQELLERSVRIRKYLDEMKNRMMMFYTWEEEHLDTELEEAGVQVETMEESAEEAENMTLTEPEKSTETEETVSEETEAEVPETDVAEARPEMPEEAEDASSTETEMLSAVVDVSRPFPIWSDSDELVVEPHEA